MSCAIDTIDWPPVSSGRQVPQRAGKLCVESCSGVSILVTAPISALIGQSDGKPNYWLHRHHVYAYMSLGRTDKLRSGQCLWLSLQSVMVHLLVSDQTVAGSYPCRTCSLGNRTKFYSDWHSRF